MLKNKLNTFSNNFWNKRDQIYVNTTEFEPYSAWERGSNARKYNDPYFKSSFLPDDNFQNS